MNQAERPDPLDELRRANPDTERRLPSESKARVWAAIQEATMDTNQKTRTRRAWAVGLAGAAVAGVVALALVVLNTGGIPAPSDDPGTGTGIGSCVETYTPEALVNRDFAFDGSVTAIDGDEVTFAIAEHFVGSGDDEVTLTATGMTGTSITSAGGPSLAVGERYLVAGDDTFAWACGFTQPYDEGVAADWANATR